MSLVTTVLTITDRLPYLKSQIKSIEDQTIKSNILIHWNNDTDYTLKYPAIIYKNQHKSKPLYDRFISSLNISTPYTFICDDDILPGKKYLEKCIEFSKDKNVCIVSCGMNFKEGETEYKVNERIGQNTFLTSPTQVHMGGQGYFFRTSLLRKFCEAKLHDLQYGEDIHLGFICWLNNIPMYVLDKNKNNKDTWQDLNLGINGDDDNAQWRYPTHKPVRSKLIKIYNQLGWKFDNYKSLL